MIDAHAERVAVRSPDARVSYGDFSRLVAWLCDELRSPKRARCGPIGLLLDRSATAYAAMWAAIALGRPYVPLNAGYPPARLRSIVRQANIDIVICTGSSRELTARLGIAPDNTVVAETGLPPVGPCGASSDWNETEEDEGIAYILFT